MATNRDLAMVNAAISQQNTMAKRIAKMQLGSMYANNTAESLLKGAKKSGYITKDAYAQAVANLGNQSAQQTTATATQTNQQSSGITADELMQGYQQWVGQQGQDQQTNSASTQNGSSSDSSGTESQQIPSLMDSVKNMSNEDIAKQINIANMVKDKTAQTEDEQNKNVADILSRLNNDSSMADKAKQLLQQRNTDYTNQTGKTDYNDAVQRTLNQTIPSLNQSSDPGTAGSGYGQYLQEQSASQDAGTADSGHRQYLAEQNANTANSGAVQQVTQQTNKSTTATTKAVEKAQSEAKTAQKKAETAQKKVDSKQTQLANLQKQLETARKEAKTNGNYSKVNSIGQQITTLKKQLSSATKEATQKQKTAQEKTAAVTTAKSAKTKAQEENNLKLRQELLTNPLATIKGKATDTSTAKTSNTQTIANANGTFKNGETLAKAQNLVTKAESGKLTKADKKEAKTVIKEYKQKIKDNDMTDADMEAYSTLQNATSAGASFMSGIVNAFPTTKAIAEKIGNEFSSIFGNGDAGTKTVENIEKQDQITKNQNAVANVAGNFAGKGAQYALFNKVADAAGATEALEGALNSKLGLNTLSSAGGTVANQARNAAAKNLTGALSRVAVGQAADTAFDTIPTLMENAKTGRYDTGNTLQNVKNVADDFAANQLQNLAFNNASELLPVVGTAVKEKLNGSNTDEAIAKSVQDQIANTTDINSRTGVDNYIIDTRKDLKQMTGEYPSGTKGDIAKTDFQNKLDAYLSAQEYLTEAINSNDENMVRLAYQKSNEYKEGFLTAAERLKQEYPDAVENIDSWIKSIDEQNSAIKASAAKQQYALADYANVPYPEVGMSYDALNTQKSNAELSTMKEADFNNKKVLSSKGKTNMYKTNYDPNKSVSKLQTTLDDYISKYGIQDEQIQESVNRAKRSINDMNYAVQNRSDVSLRQSIDEYKAAMNDIRTHSAEVIDNFDPNDIRSARGIAASGTQINTWQNDQNLVTDPERELINYNPTFEESLENRTKKAARDAAELEEYEKAMHGSLDSNEELVIPVDDNDYAKPWDNSKPETNILRPKQETEATSEMLSKRAQEFSEQNNDLLQRQLADRTDIDSLAKQQQKAAETIENNAKQIPSIETDIKPRNKTVAARREDGSIVYNAPKSASTNIPSIEDGVPKRVGRATTIYHPYNGATPTQSEVNRVATSISKESMSNASVNLASATSDEGKVDRNILKKAYNKIFGEKGGQRKVTVEGVEFEGKPYNVSLNSSAVGKITSGKDLSAERLAVFENVDDVVRNGEYVGSADFVQHHRTNKNVIRYDYFETPVEIDGKSYIVSYDVEVYKDANNYRTHKVIDEINLTERSPVPSKGILDERVRQLPVHSPDAPTQSGLHNSYIADGRGAVNSGNDAWDQLVNDVNGTGTAKTAAQAPDVNPIDAVNNLEEKMANRAAKNNDNGYVGRGYTNTIKNSGLATDDQYTKGLEEQTKHFSVSEKSSFERGKAYYDSNPQQAIKRYSASMEKGELRNLGSSDIDAMHVAYGNLNQAAKNATDPAEAEKLRRQASAIAKNLTDAQHYNAQTLQANAKWRGTSDGMLMSADGTLQRLRDEALTPKQHNQLDEAAQKISDMLQDMLNGKMNISSSDEDAWKTVKQALDEYPLLKNKFSDKQLQNLTDSVLKDKNWDDVQRILEEEMTGYSGLSTDAIDKATMLMEKAQKYNYGSRKFMELESQAYQVLAKNIMSQPGYKGKSFGQKVDSWRYLMMLGNPKTMIKNIAGNVLFGGVTEIKDNVAAVMEAAASKAIKANGDTRTKTFLNPLDSSDKALISAAKEYGENNAARALSGNKYTTPGVALDQALGTFGNSKAGRTIQWLSDRTSDILDNSDQAAMMGKYQNALARYVKANGYSSSIFSDTSEEAAEFLTQASDYAVHQAEEAAFHQDNAFARELSKFVTNLKNSDNAGARATGVMIDAAIPFKKTPANVLKSCIEYSPVEYAVALSKTRSLMKGYTSATEYIDEMAKATTGTAMYAMGALLAHEGIIRIGLGKGDNEKNTDTRTGNQNGALYIGKQSFDLSDLAPAAYPLIAGATFKESFDNDDDFMNALVNGIKSSGESLVDTTMLMGINDIFESIRYADQDESGLAAAGSAILESYAGQFLPTIGRATNATADSTQYSTYSSATGTKKQIESTGKYLETKVPGLQKLGDWADDNNIPVLNKLKLQPAVDAWGNEKKQNSAGVDAYTDNAAANAVGRAVANFATPTKTSADKSEDIDNAIRELKNSVVSDGTMSAEDADELFPYTATSEAKVNGAKLSESDWTEYQKAKGKTSKELAEALLTSGQYNDMSDADKAEILPQLYKFSKAYTASEYGGTVSSTNAKLISAYEEGGASGLIDYIAGKSEKSDFEAQVAASNSEGKSTIDNTVDYLNAVKKQDSDKASELAKQASEYQSGSYTLKDGQYVYQNNNTTKTGTGNEVTIPGPEDVGLQKSGSTTSASTTKSTTQEKDMSAYTAAHAKEWAKYSKTSTVGESGTDYSSSTRYQRVASLADIDGIETNGVGYEKAVKAIDTDGNGSMNKSEITSWIEKKAKENGWDQETKRSVFSAYAPKNWKNPY